MASYVIDDPKLMAEWDFDKNNLNGLDPKMLRTRSDEYAWWICERCGNNFESKISSRKRATGCKNCWADVRTENLLKKRGSFAEKHPELIKEWHPTKNGKITPDKILADSPKKYWWICENGHEWEATANNRNYGKGCPVCINQQVLRGYNDLESQNADLARQWHNSLNGELTPADVMYTSNKKAWWICEKGHEWKAVISTRNKGVGCPHCAKELNTSFPEQAIYYYFDKLTQTENRYLYDDTIEIDIYLSRFKIGIEYDGVYFHNKERAKKLEQQKNTILEKAGIRLLRVKEMDKSIEKKQDDNIFYYQYSSDARNLGAVISLLIERVNQMAGTTFSADVNIERDRAIIYERYIENEKRNSLLCKNTMLAEEWHPSKNGRLLPEMVTEYSNKIVWWKCKNDHEWENSVARRSNGIGCPYCANKRVLKGYNDLETRYPDVAMEWHPEKNGSQKACDVMPFSNKKAWWLCKTCGNEWEASINSRSHGNGCPHCKGSKSGKNRVTNLIKKEGSLESKLPMLAAEWHPTKNEGLSPAQVTVGSGKKAWWKCKVCGHEWQAVIGSRSKGHGCPKCGHAKKK